MGVLDPGTYSTTGYPYPVAADQAGTGGGGFFETTLNSVLGAATEIAQFKYGWETARAKAKGVEASEQIPTRSQNNGSSIWPKKNSWLNWAVGGALALGGLVVLKKVW